MFYTGSRKEYSVNRTRENEVILSASNGLGDRHTEDTAPRTTPVGAFHLWGDTPAVAALLHSHADRAMRITSQGMSFGIYMGQPCAAGLCTNCSF